MKNLQARIEEHINTLGQFTATPGNGTTRLTYSKEDRQARDYLIEKMKEYGLTVHEDGLGNIFGKLDGTLKNAPSVLIGSHFDSVPNGGSYDGPAGVVAGLEVAALFAENQIKPKYPLEVIALIEEEGARFGGGLMGSRGITGLLSEEDFKKLKDKDGITTIEAMEKIGLDPLLPKKRDPKTIKAFLELHIEQGPILEEKNIPIGVVETIVGLTQFEVTVEGQAGHAGTTPMDRRSDALVTAAKMIAQFPDLAIEEGEGTVITTGQLNVFPNGANVIPKKCVFTVDIRSGKEEHIQNVIRKLNELIESYNTNDIRVLAEQQLYMRPKAMNQEIVAQLKEISSKLELPYCSINSGAGHDAMVFSDFTDVGMLFIPSKHGLSHCPEEWSDSRHIANAVQIFFETAKKLTGTE
ncbi:Zn-dependent hydrolase [Heyndrickxia sporothermodurans]|uniref:N-carbamoyl-L-amino acid hydrolase n=1 Tax=Heyndrickxia sporothermodurans TaxID=46224 RepID=A0A150L846_9BACI|nr:Zn-dependent hydrolase [Heyndrickxia sporothermodurans]KYD08189.1 N-carbamoyl-L-amino acid hydrolase [Heyndrickxia sporothermodurans]MBL5766638.1 Zn-dependent hydrolase [Heyndrickxia sporothermodurans]MBL5770079.1 Zn-dependent hydrolase [Heyndrickxia sporothermodurans]MBL5773757.1 Zn-dependent hydrolase [Heyndrickxia sporothermodurans]MBL5777356.1 Zn-dependent hydrolase [Heyndrickxia sporothermodurans]